MKRFKPKIVFSITLLCFLYGFLNTSTNANTNEQKVINYDNEVICRSATIRSVEDFNALLNCTIVAGHIRIVQMSFSAALLEQVIPSNIEEITEYLLVYRVEGLDSLERLFPKLLVIRGNELLYDQYALVILENRELQNIGLISLLRVLRGSIRIESNPVLCFSHTINWISILGSSSKQYYYVIKNNKSPNQCPLCYNYQDEVDSVDINRHMKCWSAGKYQRSTLDFIEESKCYWHGGSSNCLTSCFDEKCRRCTNYVSNKGCVDRCLPTKYRLAFKRQCVTDCSHLGLIQFGVDCVEKCPKFYEQVENNGQISCVLNCTGNIVVNNVQDLDGLAYCTTIEGSLTIELHEKNIPLIHNLEHTFRFLNEITGYLKIIKSPQIVSLHFFKNLHTIKGQELIDNEYSLYVVDNIYLEELFPQNVAVLHGCVYFHLNPRLCYEKITDLQTYLKECDRITIKDASRNSNGEMVVCGEEVQGINATIADFNSTAALVEVDHINSDDYTILIGYAYFYKEAPFKNVTKFDGRHGCGQDSWFTDVATTRRRRHIIRDLKPATQYAYFVKTLTSMDYPYLAEYVSQIQYFETEPLQPGPVAKIYTHSLSPEEIEIHWWPPRSPNGLIDKYILQYELTNDTIPRVTNKLKEEQCLCPKLDIESHVPTPHFEEYYNKERFLYIDALNNFLIHKKVQKTRNVAEDQANLDRIDLIFKKMDERIRNEQDEGNETYVIYHPKSVCNQSYFNAHDQVENNCTPLEIFENAIEIPPLQHSYILTNLQPEKTYRISLRACVKNLANGCGVEKVVLAETVSKSLQALLETFAFYK